MTSNLTPLLGLLQLADSSFPSGTFTHSFGLEQLVAEKRIRTPGDLEVFVRSVVLLAIGPADAAAAIRARRLAAERECQGILETDHALWAMKAPRELREASVQAGRRTVEELELHVSEPMLAWFSESIREGDAPGTHAVAFGVAGNALRLADQEIAAALMFGAANAMLQAAMRVLPVSHRDVQGTLHRLRPGIATYADEVARAKAPALRSFHPVQEIASMRHRVSEVRLFAS